MLEFAAGIRTIHATLTHVGYHQPVRTPSFIASQMGHENAQMFYEVSAAWIEALSGDRVNTLNSKLTP